MTDVGESYSGSRLAALHAVLLHSKTLVCLGEWSETCLPTRAAMTMSSEHQSRVRREGNPVTRRTKVIKLVLFACRVACSLIEVFAYARQLQLTQCWQQGPP
jgi:hypothetical protein